MTARLSVLMRKRAATHGRFDAAAPISQLAKALLRSGVSWRRMSREQQEAAEMIAFKLARIVSGDPDHFDHWDDVAGYAQLGRAACRKVART